ncbi:glycosyltransferase family 39 protein [Anaerolineales bacterium HSG6]|nr:glycosyltransferase family 39 protein [Anaerolineales bacterium HSG6]
MPLLLHLVWPLLLLFIADGLILGHAPTELRYVASLLLLAVLPGWVWLSVFGKLNTVIERSLFAIGLSFSATIYITMLAVYLPGPLTANRLLIMLNLFILTGGLIRGFQEYHWFRHRWLSLSKPSLSKLNLPKPNWSIAVLFNRLRPHSQLLRQFQKNTSPPQNRWLSLSKLIPLRQAQGTLGEFKSWDCLIPVTLLFLLTLALRLPNLGYAEFHEDEAEALMLGVRVLQGEDYALFLHRKGPAQMLLPVAFWLLTERITESMARFPFVLSSILSVLTMFVLGRHWFGLTAGLVSGLLWAVNGYSIAFGRMVQYQAVIFFLGPLAIYSLYLAHKQSQPRWLYLSVILLATSLLAHFDALLLLPVAGYLLVAYVTISGREDVAPPLSLAGTVKLRKSALPLTPSQREGELASPPLGGIEGGLISTNLTALGSEGDRASLKPELSSGEENEHQEQSDQPSTWIRYLSPLFALILFVMLVTSFYIPYLLDPEFSNTTQYLSESRIKPGLLYNNLWLLRRLDAEYSSWFYLPLLVGGLMMGSGMLLRQQRSTRTWLIYGSGAILATLCLTTVWQPTWWQMGMVNMALLPWLGIGGLLFWQATNLEQRSVLLMVGMPLIGYGFLVDDPRTHLYIIYPGAVLLAGVGWQSLLGYRTPVFQKNWSFNARIVLALIGCGWLGLISGYVGLIYLTPESTFLAIRGQWDDSIGELIYDDLPKPRGYFGYPKREGWKTIGALRAEGHYQGDFRSVNEDFIVPIWYNYGQARSCYDTPAHFFVRLTDYAGEIAPPYQLSGSVTRETEPRIEIYSAMGQTHQPNRYPVESYIKQFDQQATPQRFIQQAQPSQPVGTQFGEAIRLTGYDLPSATVQAGEILALNLYWQATTAPTNSYRAFVHLTDGTTLWAQQDDNPICRLPTSIWRDGQQGMGQFRLQLNPDMPAGRYPLIIGLYQADTLTRLTITDGAGQIGDDFLWLGDIRVVRE